MKRFSHALFFLALASCDLDVEDETPLSQIIELRPASVTFAPISVHSMSTSSIMINNAGDASLSLTGVVIDGIVGPFSFRVEEETVDGFHETPLIVTFSPAAPGVFEERVEVRAAPSRPGSFVVPAEPVTLEVKGEAF